MLRYISSTKHIAERSWLLLQSKHWTREAMGARVSALLANAKASNPIEQIEVLMPAPFNARSTTTIPQVSSTKVLYQHHGVTVAVKCWHS